MRLRVFRGSITNAQLKKAFFLIASDLQEGILVHTALPWPEVLRVAEEIAEAHLTQVGARSGDLLHVASAVVLGAVEFCSFDRRQAELGEARQIKGQDVALAAAQGSCEQTYPSLAT